MTPNEAQLKSQAEQIKKMFQTVEQLMKKNPFAPSQKKNIRYENHEGAISIMPNGSILIEMNDKSIAKKMFELISKSGEIKI